MRLTKSGILMVLGLALWPLMVGAASDAGRAASGLALGAESPEAVMARLQQAARNEDLREYAACLSRDNLVEGIKEIATGILLVTAFSLLGEDLDESDEETAESAIKEKLAPLDRLLARYGLPSMTDETAYADGSTLDSYLGNIEHAALVDLFAGVVGIWHELNDEEGPVSEFMPAFQGELVDLVMEGDEATATVGDKPHGFVQVDGRWFLAVVPGGTPEAVEWITDSAGAGEGAEAATVLGLEASRQDRLDDEGRHWYVITAPEDVTVNFTTRSTGENDGDLLIEAYVNEDFGQFLIRSDSDMEGDSAHESVTVDLRAGDILHVKVAAWGFGKSQWSYQLDVSHAPGATD
jgi:hypothetical protein